jgi:hypothetical protein
MKRILSLALLAITGAAAAGLALAQSYPPPQVQTVGPTDLFQDIVRGAPSPSSVYATAGQIAGVPSYVYSVPLTAFSLTFGNSQTWYILNPAGTLATGTFTFAPNPADGQRECVADSQIQTAVTFTANTGQSVVGAPTAEASANWVACFTYVASVATWFKA